MLVTHFRHINDPNLITLPFSAGRHDGGSNTFLTVDTTAAASGSDPFVGAQEVSTGLAAPSLIKRILWMA